MQSHAHADSAGWAPRSRSRAHDPLRIPLHRLVVLKARNPRARSEGEPSAACPGRTAGSENVLHLRQLLENDSEGRLDYAALDVATIHFPELAAQPFLDQLNELASRLGDRLR